MKAGLRVEVSKYMSYLLRHNPENLKMDSQGFVDINELHRKLEQRFGINQAFVREIVEKSDRQRFEIVGNKIRALYGHTIPVESKFEKDMKVKLLYHGTTPEAVVSILKTGLRPMRRKWVHLSPTREIAAEVASRRTGKPVILEIEAEAARKNGLEFYRATDKVYLSAGIAPRYLKTSLRKETSMQKPKRREAC